MAAGGALVGDELQTTEIMSRNVTIGSGSFAGPSFRPGDAVERSDDVHADGWNTELHDLVGFLEV